MGVFIDRVWLRLASVKLTFLLLIALTFLSVPGTVVLQYNVSNIDPGLQYEYDFWRFGQLTQLFSAYHSFWYVGLIVLLALNLIACSVERWPGMWRAAMAKPSAWSPERFKAQSSEYVLHWKVFESTKDLKAKVFRSLIEKGFSPVVVEDSETVVQIFWQRGRWSRLANYLVHTSLLIVFIGAIVGALYGFEGAANIPPGSAVRSFLMFKEGSLAGLLPSKGGLDNERDLGFGVYLDSFQVNFYEKFPGRPKEFISHVKVIDLATRDVLKTGVARVNEPFEYKNFTFYQASYGKLGDFKYQARFVDRANPNEKQIYISGQLGESKKILEKKIELQALRAHMDVQGLGPGIQFQAIKDSKPFSKPFWVLKNYPEFDFQRKDSSYAVVLDELDELFFSGFQVAYDPGAPIYWFGCLGMLLGTFYALFVQHKKFRLRISNGEVYFAGETSRLPFGFANELNRLSSSLKTVTNGGKS